MDAKLSVSVPDGFVHVRSISELEIGVRIRFVGADGGVGSVVAVMHVLGALIPPEFTAYTSKL